MSTKECDGLYVRCCECGMMVKESKWEAHAATPCATAEGGRDARIAAAAPELLEACKVAENDLLVYLSQGWDFQKMVARELLDTIRGAIAKAEGGAS